MPTTTLPNQTMDISSQDAAIRKCLDAPHIKWLHSDVQCLDFHKRGKARTEWDAMWSLERDGYFKWDHVVRAQMTPKAQEFVMIRVYDTVEAFTEKAELPFQVDGPGYRELIQMGHKLAGDGPVERWFETCPDYALRLSIAAWRRKLGMCGRVLLAFRCTEESSRAIWQDLLQKTHDQLGYAAHNPLSKRVFHCMYDG